MKKTLLIAVVALCAATHAVAGDGTKENPFTVAELNAQKDALAASGAVAWVKADLKGLGEDGQSTDNADTEEGGKTVKHMAALFADATGQFTAYSWQILGQLALDDLTNTQDLLIALTYGTASHPFGNSDNPQYASNEEPADAHFSLEEVHGALTLTIENGMRGYHIPACYQVPDDIVAIKVSAGYSSKNGAYVNCDNTFDGADGPCVTPKNSALVLLGLDGTHHFVLSAKLFNQKMSNGNALYPGIKEGLYTREGNFNNYYYRFVNDGTHMGFERNSDNKNEVTLAVKDEVYLSVSAKDDNFFGKWQWEDADKKWISWTGKTYADYHPEAMSVLRPRVVRERDGQTYVLSGSAVSNPKRTVVVREGRKFIVR